jgi:CO/xanthine dehydrogenase Mo-binding subunit
MTDLPALFDSELVENHDGPGPYGAKGMGESGIVSIAPAIANAIVDATGVRIRQLPLTPERVWRALQSAVAKR